MSDSATTVLRIGGVPEHFNLPWHLAIEAGDTRRRGIAVDWVEYSTGTGAMLADLSADRLDLAVLLTEGAALGLARDLPLTAVSLYTTSPLIWGIHVPPRGGAKAPADLAGARFAISRHGSGSHLMSLAMALEHGWAIDTLEFVVVDNLPGAVAAFREGRADVFLWEHFTTQPEVDRGAFGRIGDFIAPWPAWTICATRGAWSAERDAIEALIAAAAGQAARLKSDPGAAALIAGRYGLEPAAVSEWLDRTEWVSQLTPPDAALTQARRMLETAGAV